MPPTVLRIRLRRDADGYPPFDSEQVWSNEVGDHLYELTTVPSFARGLAKGDIVRAVHVGDPEQLWVDELEAAQGHSAVRIVLMGTTTFDEAGDACRVSGCALEASAASGMVIIDVEPFADVQVLIDALRVGRTEGRWDYDVGVAADGHEALVHQ